MLNSILLHTSYEVVGPVEDIDAALAAAADKAYEAYEAKKQQAVAQNVAEPEATPMTADNADPFGVVAAQAAYDAAVEARKAVEHLRVHRKDPKGSGRIPQNPKVAAADKRVNEAEDYLHKVQKRARNAQKNLEWKEAKAAKAARRVAEAEAKAKVEAEVEAVRKAEAEAKAKAEARAQAEENYWISEAKKTAFKGFSEAKWKSLDRLVNEYFDELWLEGKTTKQRREAETLDRKIHSQSEAYKKFQKREQLRRKAASAETREAKAVSLASADIKEYVILNLASNLNIVNQFISQYKKFRKDGRTLFVNPHTVRETLEACLEDFLAEKGDELCKDYLYSEAVSVLMRYAHYESYRLVEMLLRLNGINVTFNTVKREYEPISKINRYWSRARKNGKMKTSSQK